MKNPIVVIAVAVVAAVLAAGGVWFMSGRNADPQDALTARALAVCQSNTDAERRGTAEAKGAAEGAGLGASASIGSRDVQKRGAGERVPVDQVVDENDRIRSCIERYLATHEAASR